MPSAAAESDRVQAELVTALFTATVPLVILSATYLIVGTYIWLHTGAPMAAGALVVGGAAAAGKLYLHLLFRREIAGARLKAGAAAVWDQRFAIGHLAFAAALGTLLSATFATNHVGSQLLATGLLFGFCSGQVARVAVRRRVCAISIFVAAVPCALAAALHREVPYGMLAGLFAVFAVGSLESVRFAYRQARDRIALNHELEGIASRDPLTGLLNRLGLRLAVVEAWDPATGGGMVAVHCLDLDGFKALNDRHGHAAGDALLTELAQRISACLAPGDIATRLGGDEFAVVQTSLSHVDEAEMFARRLNRAIRAPYPRAGQIAVGVSIGTCTGHVARDAFDDMLAVADRRMYAVKRAGAATPVGVPLARG